jgi:DNA repair protein RecO (recombination protein O)
MQSEAFVLEHRPSGEQDRIYILLTKELGIIEAFAKSVRKPAAKLSGHLEPPNFIWVELVESNRGWQIASALEKNSYSSILSSPYSLRIMMQGAWAMNSFIPISQADEDIWKLWGEFLEELSKNSNKSFISQRGILAQFLIRLLAHLGFFPAPEDIAPSKHLKNNLNLILNGIWLSDKDRKNPLLWKITRSAVVKAKKLMA